MTNYCEITGRQICYFVSPKFCIGHFYQTQYMLTMMLKIPIMERYPRIKLNLMV